MQGPTTPEADVILRERGIPVLPDLFAGGGEPHAHACTGIQLMTRIPVFSPTRLKQVHFAGGVVVSKPLFQRSCAATMLAVLGFQPLTTTALLRAIIE